MIITKLEHNDNIIIILTYIHLNAVALNSYCVQLRFLCYMKRQRTCNRTGEINLVINCAYVHEDNDRQVEYIY